MSINKHSEPKRFMNPNPTTQDDIMAEAKEEILFQCKDVTPYKFDENDHDWRK